MELKIGVMAHMFHAPLFDAVKLKLRNIPHRTDLHLTTCSAQNAADLTSTFSDWNGTIAIHVVRNRGRDIAPKLIDLRSAHARHDLVLHLHTKLDPDWREHIFTHLLETANVSRIIKAFEQSPRLGMISGEHHPKIKPWIGWGSNRPTAVNVLPRMGINHKHIAGLDFPSGSMFWARPAAIRPLLDLDLSADEFPPEPIGPDGTLAHTIERLFYIACEAAGYGWGTISRSGDIRTKRGFEKLYYPDRTMRLLKTIFGRRNKCS